MNFNLKTLIRSALPLALLLLLTACGGGDSTTPAKSNLVQQGGSLQGVALNLSKTVSTYAGAPLGADGTGAAARFNFPQASVAVGGNLYVADSRSHTIRKIVIATGTVTTLAGQTGISGATDGTGTAATFSFPSGITTDGTNLYVVDRFNHKIRQIVISSGEVSSLTGTADTGSAPGALDGAGTTATFFFPIGITTDGTNLYVVDSNNNKIRQIVITTGVVSSLTGAADTASAVGAQDGAGASATFNDPSGITTDGTNLYVVDSRNHTVRKIVLADSVVSTLAGTKPGADGIGATAAFGYLGDIATDGSNLYVADSGSNTIRKIVIATGVVTTLAGQTGISGAADGAGTAATFSSPYGITTDGTNLYVTDSNNSTVRKIQ